MTKKHDDIIDVKRTGYRISNLIYSRNLKASYVASELGLNVNSIYQWMNGISLPNLLNVFKLAKIFNVKVEDIVVLRGESDG